jgi:hypothetical protein
LRARFLSQQKIGAELLQGGDGRVPLSRAGGNGVTPRLPIGGSVFRRSAPSAVAA